MFLDELLDLVLSFARQVQEVVTPVGGGRLVHWAPHQGPGLTQEYEVRVKTKESHSSRIEGASNYN